MLSFLKSIPMSINSAAKLTPQILNVSQLPRQLHVSAVLCGEPMKKKRKLDPAVIKATLEKQKKKLEKRIRIQSRFTRKLKPVDELELYREIEKNAPQRQIDTEMVSREEQIRRYELRLDWTDFKSKESMQMYAKFAKMIRSQEIALRELKLESPRLHELAVQKYDENLPYSYKGPMETPPIEDFISDGLYKETTKSYELDPEIVKTMLAKNLETVRRRR